MKKFQSVSFKLIALITVLVTIYTFAICTIVYKELENGLIGNTEKTLAHDEQSLLHEINNQKQNAIKAALWIKDCYEIEYQASAEVRNRMMAGQLCARAIEYFGAEKAVVYNAAGAQISDSKYGSYPQSDYVKSALKGTARTDYISQNGIIYIISVQPLVSNGSNVGAVLVLRPVSSDIFVAEIADKYDVRFTIFDGYTRAFTSIPGMKGTTIQNKDLIDRTHKGETVIEKAQIANEDYLVDYFPLTNDAGNVIATMFLGEPLQVISHLVGKIFKPLIIVALCICVFFLVLITVAMYFLIIKKLHDVNAAVANLNSGDADLTQRLNIKGKDEFAELVKNINVFIETLQDLVKKLNTAQQSLEEIGLNLGTNSQESASATAEIMANIESVRKQTQSQSDAVNDTTSVLVQSSSNVEALVSLVNDQVAGITESSAAIEEMLGNIQSVTNSVRKMAESFKLLDSNVSDSNVKIENVSSKVVQMSEQSQMLLQANNMISQVASQTNLLAMNAAIEAAHAGEAGKGFSVVADEIRKLAETSSAQSKNINVELKGISASIQDVVGLSKESQSSFTTIVQQLSYTDEIMRQIDAAMSEQEQASQQILEALNEMKSQATEVNEKSQELKCGVDNVRVNMDAVSEISNTISGSMDEMAAGSQQISTSAQSVSDLANQTKEDIDVMNNLLGQFKA